MSRLVLFSLFAFALTTGCAVSGPFEGPGFSEGEVTTNTDGPLLAVVTYARRASGERSAFQSYVDTITHQLDETDGLIGYELRGELPGREVWTVTVWESEGAMLDFVASGAHATAMGASSQVVAEFDSAHLEVEAEDLPLDWSELLAALDDGIGPHAY